MSNELTIFEAQLQPLAPRFADALAGLMPAERLIRTLVISCERKPALLRCDRQSLINAAWSAAVLGLECDGVTGQAFLVPFKTKAQLIIGYKGFNTLGARADLTITGDVVREGDAFEFELGTRPNLHHRPLLAQAKGRIVAAWATAIHHSRPPIVSVIGIDEILAVKQRSAAGDKTDSPWNDPHIGFPAMAAKTAKRRLWRSLPLTPTMTLAARLDEAAEEQGKHAYIDHRGALQVETLEMPAEPSPTPGAAALAGDAATQGGAVVTPSDGSSLPPSLAEAALTAARGGNRSFQEFWNTLDKAQKSSVQNIGEKLRMAMDDAEAKRRE